MKRSLLIFANGSKEYIPLTVESYLIELSKYFTDIIVSTTYKGNIVLPYKIMHCQNAGRDFGLFYNVIMNINIKKYDRIAFVNDSNSLVGSFEKAFAWGEKCGLDMWGITDSLQHSKGIKKDSTYHVQSHFLIFEKKTHVLLIEFFKHINFKKFLKKDDSAELRQQIILKCEFGLSRFMIKNKMKIGAWFSVFNWKPMKNSSSIFEQNPHFHKWEELIKDGYPLIKNKIVNGEWGGYKGEPAAPNARNYRKYYRYG